MNEELIKILEAAKLVLWDGKDIHGYDSSEKQRFVCYSISHAVSGGLDVENCMPLELQNLVKAHIGYDETMYTYLVYFKTEVFKCETDEVEIVQGYRMLLIDSMISVLRGGEKHMFFSE